MATTTSQTTGQYAGLVHVSELRLLNSASTLKALATIQYGLSGASTTISAVKVFDSPKGLSVGPPQQQFVTSSGEKRYQPIITWDPDLAEAITTAVIHAYQRLTGDSDIFEDDEVHT